MKKISIIIAIIIVLIGGYFIFVKNTSAPTVNDVNTDASSAKLNIDVICQDALAYMSFPDAEAADTFVRECKEGKHPQVIERYKEEMNLDGATI